MKKNLYLIAFLAFVCLFPVVAQEKVTGFSDLKLFLDPGHSGTANRGYGDYSEAEKVLVVAHNIKEYLTTYTDMQAKNIVLSREADSDTEISFTERGDICRAMGAHLLYSIHSDAPSKTSFATLLLYGGRRTAAGEPVIEKLPEGGKQYGDILVQDLTSVLRGIRSDGSVVPDVSRGNVADRTYYGGTSTSPYLGVHNGTNGICASLLSEAGFHTNAAQNMQFVNVEHKRMQAYAAYQSLVKYLSEKHLGERIDPVHVGIVTGFVFDNETMAPINGAVVTITEGARVETYTTDTYESLPKKYKFKEDEFGNGFYWFEGFTPGATVTVKVEAAGFEGKEAQVTIPATIGATTIEGFGVQDFQLLNLMPAQVKNVTMQKDKHSNVIPRYPLNFTFSRKMDRASVEAALGLSPNATKTLTWTNDFTVKVDISQLDFETNYMLTIKGTAKNSVTGLFLDGNGDGTQGGDFTFGFTTSNVDNDPPVIVSYDPQDEQEEAKRPIVRIEFDEILNDENLGITPITVTDSEGNNIEGGYTYHATSNFKSVLHFFFLEDLKPQETYTVKLIAGLEDMYGNAMTEGLEYTFQARPREILRNQMVDNFGDVATWWEPFGSGSTSGCDDEITLRTLSNDVAYSTNSTSVRLDYLFYDEDGLVRLHRRGDARFIKYPNTTIQYYLFSDGSNSPFRITVRAGGSDGSGVIWSCHPFTLDWVGWKLMSWDLYNDESGREWLTGSGDISIPDGNMIDVKDFGLAPAEEFSEYPSYILIDEVIAVELGDFLEPGTGIKGMKAEGITVSATADFIRISANAAINDLKIYSITGALQKSAQPGQASVQIPTHDLNAGVYIVKVATEASQKNVKVIIQ